MAKINSESAFIQHVSSCVVDAWKIKPPCESFSSDSLCPIQCPYFYECFSNDV